jgi:hypothetical protein
VPAEDLYALFTLTGADHAAIPARSTSPLPPTLPVEASLPQRGALWLQSNRQRWSCYASRTFLWRGLPPPLVVYLWLKLPGCLYSADCREEVFSKTQRAREHKKKGRVKSSALLLESTFFMVRLPPTPATPVQEPPIPWIVAPPVVLPIPPLRTR